MPLTLGEVAELREDGEGKQTELVIQKRNDFICLWQRQTGFPLSVTLR